MSLSGSSASFRARTGRYSVQNGQRGPLFGLWLRANLMLGSLVGLVLGLGHQLTQLRFGEGAVSLMERLVAVVLSAIAYAGLCLVTASLAGCLLLGRGRRKLAVLVASGLLWTVLALHLLAEAVYMSAGSPLTIGAFDFFVNSFEHMSRALIAGYGEALLVVCGLSGAMAGGATWLLYRASSDAMLAGRRLAVGLTIGVGTLYGLNQLVARDRGSWSGVWAASAELAFLESLHLQAREQAALDKQKSLRPEPGRRLNAAKLWSTAAVATPAQRPNVLLIMLESVGLERLSYAGYRRPEGEFTSVSPNIDGIAETSLNMRRAWTTATHSNYAQMAVLSSLFPRRTAGLDTYKRLDYPRVLLHDFLHRLSYKTATISSQDETWQGMLRFQTTSTPTSFFHAKDHTGPLVHTGTEEVVPDHLTAERVERMIRLQHAEPWGAYVNFQMTHFPYKLPSGVVGPYSPANPDPKKFRYLGYPKSDVRRARNKYDNALHYVDRQVGRLYRALRETGQLENTILVITSDHGEQFFEHGMVTHGRSLYEVEARVPLLVHWPKGIEPMVSDAPVSHLDILPTLADLLEVAPHPSFQGESFRTPELINPKQKAVFLNIQGMRTVEAIVCWPYKLIKARQQRTPELYNLAKDPDEQDNLYHPGSETVKRLQRLLRAQMRAQLSYHHPKNKSLRDERFAPRLLTCDAQLEAKTR